ncbi:MAG: hypothetical protein ACRD12_01100 [Acidimicrobiales bacterium]
MLTERDCPFQFNAADDVIIERETGERWERDATFDYGLLAKCATSEGVRIVAAGIGATATRACCELLVRAIERGDTEPYASPFAGLVRVSLADESQPPEMITRRAWPA